MINGRPVWVQKKCQHCTACINRCPAEAIQFGRITENRGRYNIMKLGQGDTE
jgi:NAD-dependent dihydropyrimidine dehydrogenase PreA subunit